MTPSERARVRWLGAALGAGLIVLVVQHMGAGLPAGGAGQAPPSAAAVGEAGAAALPVADVRLEQLARETPVVAAPDRNPFRFKPTPPPPLPSPPATRAPALPPAALTEGPPPPPPITLRLVGVVDRETGERIAVFVEPRAQGQGSPIYGKEGDIIEGRYRVLRVSADSAELAYLDGRGRQTFRMAGS